MNTSFEYALIALVVAAAILAGGYLLFGGVATLMQQVSQALNIL